MLKPPAADPRAVAAALALLLAGCAGGGERLLDRYAEENPTPANFTVCHGYGCDSRTAVKMSESGWAEVRALFQPPPAGAAEERARVGRAVALMETLVAWAVGTADDRAAASTFNSDPGQLDCIDETVNTTTYLWMMAGDGLLRWHRVGTPARRGSLWGFRYNDFITNTAVMVETGTGAEYAVDSYFYENGHEPAVMPLEVWLDNWRPSQG